MLTNVRLEERKLITIDMASRAKDLRLEELKGAIVRLRPGPETTSEQLRAFADELRGIGVAAIKTLPVKKASHVARPRVEDGDEPPRSMSHRELVFSEASSVSYDPISAELEAELEKTLSEVGL